MVVIFSVGTAKEGGGSAGYGGWSVILNVETELPKRKEEKNGTKV